jgi:hypothetical protein
MEGRDIEGRWLRADDTRIPLISGYVSEGKYVSTLRGCTDLLQKGTFHLYNVLERSFLGFFLFFLHTYHTKRPVAASNKLPQSPTITTTSDTRDI